jgi:hypothetical protein
LLNRDDGACRSPGEQTHVITYRQQSLEQLTRILVSAEQDQVVDQPEAAQHEAGLTGRKSIDIRHGLIARHEPVLRQLSLDGAPLSPI